MDLMYNYEGNLGEKNGRINPLFMCSYKSIYIRFGLGCFLGVCVGLFLLVILDEYTFNEFNSVFTSV